MRTRRTRNSLLTQPHQCPPSCQMLPKRRTQPGTLRPWSISGVPSTTDVGSLDPCPPKTCEDVTPAAEADGRRPLVVERAEEAPASRAMAGWRWLARSSPKAERAHCGRPRQRRQSLAREQSPRAHHFQAEKSHVDLCLSRPFSADLQPTLIAWSPKALSASKSLL